MAYSCHQCPFTAQFESALIMHRQLHHDTAVHDIPILNTSNILQEKSNTIPRSSNAPYSTRKDVKGFKLPTRTLSATRLFDKLRARICKSRTLFSHPEENINHSNADDLHVPSECTSKTLKADCFSGCSAMATSLQEVSKETYGCHLCTFDADRITVLDRHLLNDHRIGLDNLLKLVLAKTKDSLAEEPSAILYGVRESYYKSQDEILEEGEFVIETVTPTIKILKHASTNTDIKWADIPDLKNNCRVITEELEKMMNPMQNDKEDFLNKVQTLNRCMCKFVDSSNTLKKVLAKEFDSKSARERLVGNEPMFDLGLGDRDTPRDWETAHSEKMDRNRVKYGEKSKLTSESFYF